VAYVNSLNLSRSNTWMTKFTFKHMLLKRAYTETQMTALVGMDVRLIRRQPLAEQAA
jgi:hypothetical protein